MTIEYLDMYSSNFKFTESVTSLLILTFFGTPFFSVRLSEKRACALHQYLVHKQATWDKQPLNSISFFRSYLKNFPPKMVAWSEVDTVTILYSCQTSFTYGGSSFKRIGISPWANARQKSQVWNRQCRKFTTCFSLHRRKEQSWPRGDSKNSEFFSPLAWKGELTNGLSILMA